MGANCENGLKSTRHLSWLLFSVKRLNGWSGFLTRTYLIGKEIIMSRTLVTPYRLFNATEIKTRQPKLVLKLSLAQSNDDINDDYNLTFTRCSVRKTAQAVARFATASDNTVKRALSKWIKLQTGLVSCPSSNVTYDEPILLTRRYPAPAFTCIAYSTRRHQSVRRVRSIIFYTLYKKFTHFFIGLCVHI